MITKICTQCKQPLPATAEYFYRQKKGKNGLNSWCKKCTAKYRQQHPEKSRECSSRWSRKNPEKRNKINRKWNKSNPEKVREAKRKRTYGLLDGQYNQMLKQQNGLCAICGLPETTKHNGKVKLLAIDHNHRTGKIRGLLCRKCNTGIGGNGLDADNQNIELLCSAISYIRNNDKEVIQ